MSTAIVVACCHRTGSGCVASVLHTLGVPMLEQPDPVREGDGRWEDLEFFRLHQQILREWVPATGKYDHRRWWYPSPCYTPELVKAYKELVERRNQRMLWGFKDPRTIFMLDFTLGLLTAAGVDVRIVWLTRDLMEIADSLQRRDGERWPGDMKDVAKYQLRQWQLMQERYAAAYPGVSFTYAGMTAEPAGIVDQLIGLMPFGPRVPEARQQAIDLIRPVGAVK